MNPKDKYPLTQLLAYSSDNIERKEWYEYVTKLENELDEMKKNMACARLDLEWPIVKERDGLVIEKSELLVQNEQFRGLLKIIEQELGDSPAMFVETKDWHYQNPNTKIQTVLNLIKIFLINYE